MPELMRISKVDCHFNTPVFAAFDSVTVLHAATESVQNLANRQLHIYLVQ